MNIHRNENILQIIDHTYVTGVINKVFLGMTKLQMVLVHQTLMVVTPPAVSGCLDPATARGETGGLCARAGNKHLYLERTLRR